MFREGKPQGPAPQSETDHFIRCTICGKMLDMCDLGSVLDHLHGEEIEEEPAAINGGPDVACSQCGDTHWVCENHADRPWDGPKARGCGGAGDPSPACNDAAPDEMPLPPGFENSLTSVVVMRPLLRNPAGTPRPKPRS